MFTDYLIKVLNSPKFYPCHAESGADGLTHNFGCYADIIKRGSVCPTL